MRVQKQPARSVDATSRLASASPRKAEPRRKLEPGMARQRLQARKSDAPARNNQVWLRSTQATKAKPDVTRKTHPHWFTDRGELKWKVPPKGVRVIANKSGEGGWIEKWQNPKTGAWVHNYTARFIAAQAARKFDANRVFADKLPGLRKQLAKDLARGGKEGVLALAVTLIDRAYFRVGNEVSEGEGVYGTTTLLVRHVRVRGSSVTFDFVGKKRVHQDKTLDDRVLSDNLRALLQGKRPSDRVFAHAGRDIHASDVNAYLAPFGVTAKMFRTYHATRLARAQLLGARGLERSERGQAIAAMFESVARELGHTPAVCRQSYVDPRVVEMYQAGRLR